MKTTTQLTSIALLTALSCSVASGALTTTTTFDGAGAVGDAANWDDGIADNGDDYPTNAKPGLIDSVTGATWMGPTFTDFAVRQTTGYIHRDTGNVDFRGGASAGIDTIWEIADLANADGSSTNFNVGGIFTMWSQNGGGHQLTIESGKAVVGSLNTATTAAKSSISVGNGLFSAGSLDQNLKVTFNLLQGNGEIFIGDTLGVNMAGMLLDFETGSNGSFTIGAVNGASSLSLINWLATNDRVLIDGVAQSSFGWDITQDGIATTIAIPEPGTYALLAGCFALASVMIRRRR